MLSFLKKFKKVKKAKGVYEKEDSVFPKHNLFWAEIFLESGQEMTQSFRLLYKV